MQILFSLKHAEGDKGDIILAPYLPRGVICKGNGYYQNLLISGADSTDFRQDMLGQPQLSKTFSSTY